MLTAYCRCRYSWMVRTECPIRRGQASLTVSKKQKKKTAKIRGFTLSHLLAVLFLFNDTEKGMNSIFIKCVIQNVNIL